MNKICGSVLLIAAMAFAKDTAFAVPAKPGLLTMTQSDGTEINVRLVGDEHAHYYLSEDGYLLINDNDTFYYGHTDAVGNIVCSDIVARPAALRTSEARLFLENVDMDKVFEAMKRRDAGKPSRAPRRSHVGLFETGFPSMGEQKGLVVLVEYTDVKFNLSDPYDYFNRMLNETGFNEYGGTGCAAEYFRECSMNKFRPQFDVYGPITLSHNMSYYGGNGYSGDDQNPQKMAIEACQQLDATVDFSEYDRDGDGYIDNVFVFYAGRGEASGGAANTVWPHAWNVTAAEYTPYIFDGVQLDRYACSNEWEGSRPDGVGTFIHEFSHVMGLPDLYATGYTNAFTPGAWSVLDYGPYNNDGCTPPLYSIYERYSLGWIEPTVLNGPATVSLNSISSNRGCIIPTGDENEFFLIENRQQTGWDAYIPGHGMLVWHVDYDPTVWERNAVNNTASHQYVDIEEADGTQSEYSRSGDAFPGTSRVTSFTDNTTPSMKTWAGRRLNLPITNITENGGTIRFDVAGGRPVIKPVTALNATDVTADSFTAHWQASESADSYSISVYMEEIISGSKIVTKYVDGYNLKDVGNRTSVVVEGLLPLTEYHYVIYAVDRYGRSEASNEIAVTTGEPSFSYLAPVALEATAIESNSFTANWQPMEGAVGYMLDIYTKILGDFSNDVVDFSDGVSNLPAGWTSNSKQAYANEVYAGDAIPSLRFAKQGCYIESPKYSGDVRSLTFWHRGVNAAEENVMVVSVADQSGVWSELDTLAITNEKGGKTIIIDEVPAGTRKIRIAYDMQGTGSLALDDIAVEWGGTETIAGGFTLDIQYPATAQKVKDFGLQPSTTYYYTVTATDGMRMSRPSNEIKVLTAAEGEKNGLYFMQATTVRISIADNRLIISGANGESILVTDVAGRQLFYDPSVKGDISLLLPLPHGVYIIRCGANATYKIRN